jgi:hypothetical protein
MTLLDRLSGALALQDFYRNMALRNDGASITACSALCLPFWYYGVHWADTHIVHFCRHQVVYYALYVYRSDPEEWNALRLPLTHQSALTPWLIQF